MANSVADLDSALANPEVLSAMEVLGRRGLGVTVLHSHDDTSDVMVPFVPGTVQFEDDLQVRFVDSDDPVLTGSVPVTAVWINGGPVVVGRCRQGHGEQVPPPVG
ncbi:hypothetical protein E4P41_20565 [Geodermatophilus sp. DF01-2]|uniref:hypothetical protein n=1 Tax=Geodermatophilus sp. DF01-2 TaxID=2559610 RepID=UPI0010749C92|nr:hypothetical protein [Geodermatophilus sp. DF01_2]TFV53906.1 hypothetical protein E4P41_20565 [Geodermatophilus sp. DF01_2]